MSQRSILKSKDNQILILWAVVIVALCGFSYFYQAALGSLFNFWNNYGTYSHGYLTVLLTAYLVYVCVKEGQFNYSGLSGFSAIFIILISIIWIFSYLANINTFQMLCVPFFIFFTLTYFIGLNNYRILLVPVFILLFTVPIWSSLLPYLQEIAVIVTNKLLSFSSFDYRVVGNQIIFSQGIFQVEESCSGLRYLLVGILLAVVYGFLNYQSYWSALLLVLSTIVIMLIGNFVRILAVIGLGVFKGMDYPLVQDHQKLGWVLFAFLLIPMFVIARYLKPNIGLKVRYPSVNVTSEQGNISLNNLLFALVFYLIIVSVSPLYAVYLKNNINEVATLSAEEVNPSGGWMKLQSLSARWQPNYSLYSRHLSEQFKKDDQTIDVNIFLYTAEVPGGELINFNNQLADGDRWVLEDASYHQVMFENDALSVNKVTVQSTYGKDCFRLWYWFDVGGNFYAKKWQVKLYETLMIFNGKSGSAFTSISTGCSEKDDEILSSYIVDNFSQIKNLIVW